MALLSEIWLADLDILISSHLIWAAKFGEHMNRIMPRSCCRRPPRQRDHDFCLFATNGLADAAVSPCSSS